MKVSRDGADAMRINNILDYTEHHRYYIFRDFSLSSMDFKMLSLIYQPMIGAFAVALYQQLYYGIAEGTSGYSTIEPQRKLFLGLGLEMNERSRKHLIEQASKLEAVGLLQTSRLGVPENVDVIYEYELAQPLTPSEFFRNMHLTMLLRDKVGKYAVISLRESFGSNEPDELAGSQLTKEDISVPFYELFKLNMQSVDDELEQALTEVAPSRQASARPSQATAGIPYGEIILRFPRNSVNRKFVERLRSDEEQLAQVNYVAYKYNLSVVDICRLLDEDGIFSDDGALNIDELQLRANQFYRQDKKREGEQQRKLSRIQVMATEEQHYLAVPNQLLGRCDVQQYNMLMRNEPHTRFLQRFFPGAIPDWIERVFERIDLNYKLAGPVINVLIHYVIGANDAQRVTKTFLDAVASNMLVKQIDTFEKAVIYVREQAQVEQDKERRKEAALSYAGGGYNNPKNGARSGGSSRGTSRKPSIPIVQEGQTASAVSADELEELRKLARKLDGNR
jgi:replication initiation and membrane attachment protein